MALVGPARERLHTWPPRTREGNGLDPSRLTPAVPRAQGWHRTPAWTCAGQLSPPWGTPWGCGGRPRPAWGEQAPMGAPCQGLGPALARCWAEPPVGGQTGDSGPLRAATTAAPGGTGFLGGSPEPAVLQLCLAPPGRWQLRGRPPRRVSRARAPRPSGARASTALPPASLCPVPPGMAPAQRSRAGGILVPGWRWRGPKGRDGKDVALCPSVCPPVPRGCLHPPNSAQL